MDRELLITGDGSHTLQITDTPVTYNSRYGAIQECEHVYIGAGLQPYIGKAAPIRVLEVSFGTGLNAFLTYLEAKEENAKIEFETLEPLPLVRDEYRKLNYAQVLRKRELAESLQLIHQTPWNKNVKIGPLFSLHKHQTTIEAFETNKQFHVIFYNAFTPEAHPEFWTAAALEKMYDLLLPDGILTTYCSKGEVRRTLESVGFSVEKMPGPWGKREMVRAHKPA